MEEKIRNSDLKFTKDVSTNLQHFIKSLLTVDVSNRLGTKGVEEIQAHPWLKKVNFDKVHNKVYKPPFIPQIQDQFDTN
eukprot:CAMPEP_0116932276 /NCGR_PEP_ID=MMETSP0467-20121206/28332_1 /TAXON_ID=283647 /ORGANISM="Mesodinium pulex, Strain SPMC105" /LENGTH=78 /DNA_ID=CAMNT_0004612909 /DNA_START=744 /DNA_END=980 /DNA_ORIENTATION=+